MEYVDDFFSATYVKKTGILTAAWKACNGADDFINSLKRYKVFYDNIKAKKVVWNHKEFFYDIPPALQQWLQNFLDKPAFLAVSNLQVAHVLRGDVESHHSLINMYTDNSSCFVPRFFLNEKDAQIWVDKKILPKQSEQGELVLESIMANGQARLSLELDLSILPDYMAEFKKFLQSRTFFAESFSLYQQLGTREKEILGLITHGFTNHEIANRLYLAFTTVRTHRKNIYKKLRCKCAADLMKFVVFY
ncbi:regulatory protein, luxR family [bacterium A37T11]|nr:regulatory protein, luxR family [bacterium A37T11]